MKRFAANYLYIPELGFLKQHVVEITDSNELHRVFPLTEEIASVVWLPGLLILTTPCLSKITIPERAISLITSAENKIINLQSQTDSFLEVLGNQVNIVSAFPFDFEQFKPCAETVYRLIE